MLPQVEAYALSAIRFDHSPLLCACSAKPVKKRKVFRFETFWIVDVECREVIKQSWQSPSLDEVGLRDKLKAVTHALWEWSKQKFPNNHLRINALK